MKRAAGFTSLLVGSFLLLSLLSGCGSSLQGSVTSTTPDTSSTTGDEVTAPAVGGQVSVLTLDSDSSEIVFSDIEEDDEILLMLHAYSDAGASSSFQIGASENMMFLEKEILGEEVEAEEGDATVAFHDILRQYEEQLDEGALLGDGGAKSAKYLIKKATVGYQKSFKVLNSFSSSSSYDTVIATLRYVTSDFEIYVDNRNATTVTQADLSEIAERFAAVLPLEKEIFGEESDVDANNKFAVLLTQTVNELGGSAGGMITGFFYAVDLFDSDQYAISNEMEVFYTFVPDPEGELGSSVSKDFAMTNIYPGVLAHEFQHVINFNMHYNINGGSMEKNWLNEGLSHLAEDIYSHDSDGYMTTAGLENPARVSSYLSDISNICFTCGTSLKERGGSYLFLRYLYEQAELGNLANVDTGNELLTALLDTDLRGTENVVNAVFGSTAVEEDFNTLLGLFGLTVYLSNTGNSNDDRFGFTGLNLRAAQDDNRGTVLDGPAVQSITDLPFVETISGSGFAYLQISGKTIIENGGRLDFSFGSNSTFGGYMIRE
ncbi:MAG: hypothetical protein HQM16_06750 [Deltaproteobacteria bacterium]|nr:hypothetical protein [Deltaproteobacteria bacterium]